MYNLDINKEICKYHLFRNKEIYKCNLYLNKEICKYHLFNNKDLYKCLHFLILHNKIILYHNKKNYNFNQNNDLIYFQFYLLKN